MTLRILVKAFVHTNIYLPTQHVTGEEEEKEDCDTYIYDVHLYGIDR